MPATQGDVRALHGMSNPMMISSKNQQSIEALRKKWFVDMICGHAGKGQLSNTSHEQWKARALEAHPLIWDMDEAPFSIATEILK